MHDKYIMNQVSKELSFWWNKRIMGRIRSCRFLCIFTVAFYSPSCGELLPCETNFLTICGAHLSPHLTLKKSSVHVKMQRNPQLWILSMITKWLCTLNLFSSLSSTAPPPRKKNKNILLIPSKNPLSVLQYLNWLSRRLI